MTSPIGTTQIVPVIAQAHQTIRAPANPNAGAADKFEAMAISQMLKPIFATIGKADAPFGAGSTARAFQPFLIDAIAKSMEARGGLGLAPMIEAAISAQSAKGGTGTAVQANHKPGGLK